MGQGLGWGHLNFGGESGRIGTKEAQESKWGSGFFNQLSLGLRSEFPNATGFSVTNLKYMKRWYAFYYEEVESRQWSVDEIPLNQLNMPELFGHLPWGTAY